MSDEEKSDESKLGFRDPPVNITRPCLWYMGRVMELREFVGFYFSFVKTSQKLSPIIAAYNEKNPSGAANSFVSVEYSFSKHRQLVNEIMLSRAVESFDLYLLNILRVIFETKPEILKSDKLVDAATLIELRTPEEIIYYLAERQLNELGYKPLIELRKWIKQRTGIDFCKNDEIFETALLASEVRNLIAHNDCMANETIRKRIGQSYDKLSISETGKVLINDAWLRKISYTLDGIVFDFDEATTSKFDVYRANRFGTFFFRE